MRLLTTTDFVQICHRSQSVERTYGVRTDRWLKLQFVEISSNKYCISLNIKRERGRSVTIDENLAKSAKKHLAKPQSAKILAENMLLSALRCVNYTPSSRENTARGKGVSLEGEGRKGRN